jgi:hypothetical protein
MVHQVRGDRERTDLERFDVSQVPCLAEVDAGVIRK